MKKKNKKTKLSSIILCLCILLGILFFLFIVFMAINSNNYFDYEGPIDEEYYNNPEKIDEELNKHYKIKDYVMPNGEILIEIKNNNKYGVEAEIYLDLMDSNDKVLASGTMWTTINPNSKNYEIKNPEYLFPDEAGVSKEYDHYKIRANLKYSSGIKFYNKCIKTVDVKRHDYKMSVILKNNCEDSIEYVDAGVLFYDKNKNIIGFDNGYIDKIRKNGKAKMNIFIPDSGDSYEEINYSSYKVVILGAYNI